MTGSGRVAPERSLACSPESGLAGAPTVASKVIDTQRLSAELPQPIKRYRALAADLGNAPIDMVRGRNALTREVRVPQR